MALAIFALAWMLSTMFRDWPKPHQEPHIVSEIRWKKEDANPGEVVGSKIVLKLEEHYPTRFAATIEGSKSVLSDEDDEGDFWKNDRIYILRPQVEGSASKATGTLLFHPEWLQFKRGVNKMLLKKYHGYFSYRPSMEELLLNPECLFKEVWGRVYRIQNPDLLAKSELLQSDLRVPDAIGKVTSLRDEGSG